MHNITLQNANYTGEGGAIYCIGNFTLNGSNISFEDNSAGNGGAIYSNGGNVVVNGSDVSFVNNSATYGGAIYSYGNVVVDGSDICFEDNSATYDGGAIFSMSGNVSVDGFNISFKNNNATEWGGAIYSNGGNVVVNGSDVSFVNNSAEDGGAIYSYNGNVVVDGSDICFEDNSAEDGGAIVSREDVAVNGFNISFKNNNATEEGGAIYSDDGNVTVGSDICFVNNSAELGGAIYSDDGNVIVDGFDVSFVNNSATADELSMGGAIYSDEGNVIVDGSSVCFINNSAMFGGAIMSRMGNVTVNGTNISFEDNSATFGGAILSLSGAVVDGALFVNNTATLGGGIYVGGISIMGQTIVMENMSLNVSNSEFYSNVLDVIYSNGTLYLENNTLFNGRIFNNGTVISEVTLNVLDNSTLVAVYDDEITLNATLTDDNGNKIVGGEITLTGTPSGNLSIFNYGDDGVYVANYTANELGSYNIGATYSGGSNVTVRNGTLNVKLAAIMDITVSDVVYGESAVVSGTLTTNEDDSVDGMVDITVDGRTYQVSVNNGVFRLNVPNLDAGSYTVNAVFKGDAGQVISSDSTRFTVSKANPSIKVDVEDIVYGEDAVIYITLGGAYGSLDGNVEVTVGYISETVQVIRGEGVLVVSDLPAGDYTVSAVYTGSANYNSADAYASFNVGTNSSAEVEVDIGDVIVTGNETDIYGNITDGEGNPLDGNLTVVIGNETVTVPVVDGEFEVMIPESIPAGEYNASVVFEGEGGVYSNTTIIITVPNASEIIAEDLVMYYKNGSQFTAQLIVGGKPQANANVTITINGISYNRITDENGFVSMDITLSPGVYDITVSYGDMSVDSTVTVLSTLESSDLVKYFKNASQYNVLVLEGNGNPLANSTVEFNINGVFYNRTTNSEGVATLNINLNPGTYIITAINHGGLMVSNNVTVLSTIAADDIVKYHLNDTQYLINVVDSQGNPLANKSVIINIHGVFYNRTTDENGIAVLNINLSPGDYIATVYDLESGLALSNNIKVLPVLSGDDLEMNYHDGSKYNAKLVDSHGNPLEGETITFNINGVFYNKNTDADGVTSLDINLNPGDYIITAYWGEIANSNTISVKQN